MSPRIASIALTLMQPPPHVFEFCRLLGAVVRMGHYSAAISLIERMDEVDLGFSAWAKLIKLGLRPNSVTLSTLVNGLSSKGIISKAVMLADEMLNFGFEPDPFTCATIIKGFAKTGKTDLAVRLIGKGEKLNTDGAVRDLQGVAGAGGILRNSSGGWIIGFMQSLGFSTVTVAELYRVLTGLKLAWMQEPVSVVFSAAAEEHSKSIAEGLGGPHPTHVSGREYLHGLVVEEGD
ncbi:hypothetical protein CRG98_016972 [Punica granatum]|uniref:RNase H type-1 domain-containing protein n=1 Tax=Punica granatum TaxID=22663 RepID=A0A2I0K2C4_PUNGR|nr:hypothetical protein CRG98_016972 [Punica granatum]